MQEKINKIHSVFAQSKLSDGIEAELFNSIFRCLHIKLESFNKDSLIFNYDEPIDRMAMILSGSVDFSIIQFDGSVSLINRLGVGDSLAEGFACGHQSLGVFEYRCVEDTELLFMDVPKACTEKVKCKQTHKYKIMENMMSIIAEENIFLNKKIFILSQKKLRDKLLTYIKMLEPKANEELWIPFNRQDLANFIGADRSAVSRELMRMQKDNIIEIKANKIKYSKF